MTLVEPTQVAPVTLADALIAIDIANLEDPTLYYGESLAFVQGMRATAWLRRLDPEASEAVALAVRAHHLKRWEIERSQYPEGRHGYLRWRRDNKAHQQHHAADLLLGIGVDADTVAEVGRLLLRSGLGSDRNVQLLEDAACLVFLETQFDELTAKLDHQRMVSVVAKTLKKMSPVAIELAGAIMFSAETAAVLEAALTNTTLSNAAKEPTMTIPELSLDDAWAMLRDDSASVLVDVRTQAEWSFVGVPVLDDVGKQARFAEWTAFPTGDRNQDFVTQAAADLATETPILLLCRSGARSLAAARALNEAGYTTTYNVTAGFEGDLDQGGHRHGGWKSHLPWRQG